MFAMSAILVDKAEPSEALKTNIAWSLGLDSSKKLLSSSQIYRFIRTGNVEEEFDITVPFNANVPEISDFDVTSVGSIVRSVENLVAEQN